MCKKMSEILHATEKMGNWYKGGNIQNNSDLLAVHFQEIVCLRCGFRRLRQWIINWGLIFGGKDFSTIPDECPKCGYKGKTDS